MYFTSRELAKAFPDRFVLECDAWLDVDEYVEDGLCTWTPLEDLHNEFTGSPGYEFASVDYRAYNTGYSIQWKSEELLLLFVGLSSDHGREVRKFLIGRNQEITEQFFLEVCKWNSEVRGEILVFNGCWSKDEHLYESIQGSTLDNLILEGNLKQQIAEDFASFFASKETYDRYGIPWKRGVLLLGPPGNGKTHCIKALVNMLGLPCLYARTFERDYGTDQGSISQVFGRARSTAPCILVLEDLDTLLTDKNRSFFLNEMDGFAANTGVMVVATTNHPERLDPAILERPSRFDRKYTFHLPDLDCREQFIRRFTGGLEEALVLSDEDCQELATLTEGFSFAYLKELFLSGMMAWIGDKDQGFLSILKGNVDTLLSQMQTAPPEPTGEEEDGDDMFSPSMYMRRWHRTR